MARKPNKPLRKIVTSGRTETSAGVFFRKVIGTRLLLIFLLVPFWVVLRSVYRDRIGSFGCFDDCNNIMGGYFLLQGKKLFSEIFFNHMPLMAHISWFIQWLTRPDSIVMLIYRHRMVIVYLSILGDILLTLRFGAAGFGFAVFYETTKGYLFGERFLAESVIVYPVVYLWGTVWKSLRGYTIYPIESWIAVNLTWFVLFMREPYIPLVLVLFGLIVWQMRKTLWGIWSVALLALMCFATVIYYGIGDFIFNVFTVNRLNIVSDVAGMYGQTGGLLNIFLYPVILFFTGRWNSYHATEALLTAIFILYAGFSFRTRHERNSFIIFFIILTLSNIRPVQPGTLYYSAFHHLQWYGLLVFTVSILITDGLTSLSRRKYMYSVLSVLLFTCCVLYQYFSGGSLIREKVDRQAEFTTNFSVYFVAGDIIRLLSVPGDTLFVDGQDDLIYWQAKRYSDYPYSWYTSLMPYIYRYTSAREKMFTSHPPAFYWGTCNEMLPPSLKLPVSRRRIYTRMMHGNTPSCLFIRNDKIPSITPQQWQSVETYQYTLPRP